MSNSAKLCQTAKLRKMFELSLLWHALAQLGTYWHSLPHFGTFMHSYADFSTQTFSIWEYDEKNIYMIFT